MLYRIKNLIWMLVVVAPHSLRGQSISDLSAILHDLKAEDTYCYTTDVRISFPNGDTDSRSRTVYMDRPRHRVGYEHEDQLLLMNEEWVLAVNKLQKTISIFRVDKYNQRYKRQLPELEEIMKVNLSALIIDSLYLNGAKVASYSRNGALGTFVVSFPATSIMQRLELVYNYETKFPERIHVVSFTPARRGERKGTTIDMRSSKYRRSVPDSVFDMSRYFIIRQGKVVLRQYKDYEVSSIY